MALKLNRVNIDFQVFLLFQSIYAIDQTRHVCHSQVLTSARLRTFNNLL